MKGKVLLAIIAVIFVCLITSCNQQATNEKTASPTLPPSSPATETVTPSSPSSSIISLLSITITPKSPNPLPVGSVQDFKATGKYSDGSTIDITSQVTWASSDESVASMYPYGGAFARSEGITNITATLDDVTSSAAKLSVPSNDTSILVYLDSNYTKLWDSVNQPDLSVIHWEPSLDESTSPYSWEQGILTVYLWNTGGVSLKVNAENNLHAMQPGISVRSDTITLKPGEQTPLDITIKQSPEVLGFSGGGSFNVWFNIREID
ncbi:Ig-like domain-containing protein [Chloroflexota bacterium]